MARLSDYYAICSKYRQPRRGRVEELARMFAPGTLVSVVWLGPPDADFNSPEPNDWQWSSEELDEPAVAVVLEPLVSDAFVGGTEREGQREVIPFLCLCRGKLHTSTTWLSQPVTPR